MMNFSTIKKSIAVAVAASMLFVAYYGEYLPLRKSKLFIHALNVSGGTRSVEEFEQIFLKALESPSPIGQEELVRNLANTVLGILQTNNDPLVVQRLVGFIDSHYLPIIASGHGMSFTQNLYVLGAIHETAGFTLKDPAHIALAKNYFLALQARASKRPQTLYGLFDIYRFENDRERAREVGSQILSQWPNDARIRKALDEFLPGSSGAQ